MTTPRDILVAAFGTSSKNRPEQITPRSDELFEVAMRAMRGIYSFGAEVNPEYFGDSEQVALTAGAPGYWARPAKAESIWYIENPGGKEVIVVPRTQLTADIGRPAIYRLGRKFYSAGNPLDPTSGALRFFYSARAVKPGTVDAPFDDSWPSDFDGFLVEETAIYLALGDGRADEAALHVADRDKWAQRFAKFLEHETVNVVYAYGASRNYNVPDLIKTLLATVPA